MRVRLTFEGAGPPVFDRMPVSERAERLYDHAQAGAFGFRAVSMEGEGRTPGQTGQERPPTASPAASPAGQRGGRLDRRPFQFEPVDAGTYRSPIPKDRRQP